MIATGMLKDQYQGDAYIYCHEDLADTIRTLCRLTIQEKHFRFLDSRIHLDPLKDGDHRHILSYDVTFFDIHSTKARQFGFTTVLKNGKKLTCAGDEPYNAACEPYVKGSDWLLHEAFCLYDERDRFKPYEKHHSTVKDAAELAESLQDKSVGKRKELYMAEGKAYYHGNLYIPEDRDILTLS